MAQKPKSSNLHKNFMWSAIVAFLLIFAFNFGWVKDRLGSYLVFYENADYTVCLVCAIVGGRETLGVITRIFKSFSTIKAGEEGKDE